ncbi:hypothetical protein [Helicobacter sp.]|uniref:beta strand repeat-containing protein n=1 Tax=Helicobacter sp. TaxID=218 RepID=UPI002A91E65B|nr:hypothetical protein [Helicobacter sp.]
MNTNNTKFTFNKKGFALSLACVGLLATAGNAAITPANTVQVDTGTKYNVTVSNPSGAITVTDENTSLGFVTSATVYISAGKPLTIEGDGSIGTLNVWNASTDKGFSLSGAGLTFNTKIGTLNLGTTPTGASGAITMGSGGALTIKNTVGTINLTNIIHKEEAGSGATITLDQATIGNFNFNQLITGNSGLGSDLSIDNSGVITNFTIDEKGGYKAKDANASGGFTLTNSGTITKFINKGLLEGNTKSDVTIKSTGTIGTFENAGKINTATISGSSIGTFNNTAAGVINNSTIKVNVNDFTNAGTITTGTSSAINVYNSFNNAEKADFKLNGTLTLQGAADVKDAKTTFDNAGLFSGGTINIVNNVLTFNNATTGTINKSTISGTGTIQTFTNAGTITSSTLDKTLTIGTFNNTGKITNSTINVGNKDNLATTFTNAAKSEITGSTITVNVNDFNNAGTITTGTSSAINVYNSFKNEKDANFTLDGTLTLQGAADVKDAKKIFDNAGLFSGGTIKIVDNVLTFNNATTGTIKNSTINGTGTIQAFTNAGTITGSTLEDTLTIGTFNNTGKITNSTIKVGTEENLATTFTNAGEISIDGTVDKNALTVFTKDFTNEKTIKFESGSKIGTIAITADNFKNVKDAKIDFEGANNGLTIIAKKTFDNAGTIKGISGGSTANAGTITLKTDADSKRNATFAGTNSGLIQVDTIKFEGFHKSFDNSGTISGGNISADTDMILTFTNTADGAIKGSKIEADVDDFNNLGSITAEAGSWIGVYNSFNNAEKADFKLGGTLSLGEGDVRDAKITFNNAGNFSGGAINIGDNVLAFNNTATGEIKGTEIRGAKTIQTLTNDGVMSVKANNAKVAKFQNTKEFALSGGGILNVSTSFNNAEKATLAATDANATILLGNGKAANTTETTFNNAGTIDGKTNLAILTNGWVKSFTNTGLIDGTTIGNGTNGIVTFENSGTIDNSTLQVNVVHFNNLEGGLIDFRGAANSSINLSGALDKTASFNNAGTIDNLPSEINVDANVANVSFKNSGSIYQGATANTAVLNLKGASNILDFNNSGTIALAGTNTSAAITATTAGAKANIINTGAITLGNTNSAHLDLTNIQAAKDAPFVVKEWHLSNIGSANAYNGKYTSDGRDKIVVKGFARDITAGTSKLRFDKGSIVIDPVKNPKMVSGQPYLLDRIVVDGTGAPVEEIHKDDGTKGTSYDNLIAAAYELNKDTNTYTLKAGVEDPRLVTFDTIRSSDPIFELYGVDAYASDGKVGEVIPGASGATTTRKGDGIIDSFQVGVNPSKGAGAAVVQSAVNNSITRSAFVGNVVNTAVNSALASLNNFNRVSYNDEEVDFEKLEKYAAVSSDVTDQTYAKDSNVYVMPYYRSTSVDLADGSSLDADTYGIVLGGNKNLGNAGVIGLFLGYENADGSANTLDTEDDTFFGGINYYKTLGGTSTYDYFVKGMLRLANTSSDLTRQGQGTSSVDTFSYGIEANVGMNFYNGIHTITPEVGLSYDRAEVDGFTLGEVTYDDAGINLPVAKVGLNWLAQFTESVSTNVGVGIRYNLNDDYTTSLKIPNGGAYSTKTDLGDFYYYLNLGVNYAITSNWELGVMYNGDFSSDASSHSGFVKLGYWW